MALFAVPNVSMYLPASLQGQAAGKVILLSDGSSLTLTGGAFAVVPLTQVPAAIGSGFTYPAGAGASGAQLLKIPSNGPGWAVSTTMTLLDGVTTSAIDSQGRVVIPNIFVAKYLELGFTPLA